MPVAYKSVFLPYSAFSCFFANFKQLGYLTRFEIWEIHSASTDVAETWIAKKLTSNGDSTNICFADSNLRSLRRRVMRELPYVPDCIDTCDKNQPSLVESWF